MIKISHIEKNEEEQIALKISKFLSETYKNYCEIKVYGNTVQHAPTLKIENKR